MGYEREMEPERGFLTVLLTMSSFPALRGVFRDDMTLIVRRATLRLCPHGVRVGAGWRSGSRLGLHANVEDSLASE